MKFEMPKMNVAIFSCENIVTTSGETPTPTTVTNASLAQKGLEAVGVSAGNITTVSANAWINEQN